MYLIYCIPSLGGINNAYEIHLNRVAAVNSGSHAEKARAQKTANALAIGIDDALISRLVEHFYGVIRTDFLLGPIFAAHVADWPTHLTRMKDFWASVTLESGRFRGSPMTKHIALGGLERPHFEHWLHLWKEAVKTVVPEEEAAEVFLSAAERIATSLLTGIQIHCGGPNAILAIREKQSC